MINIPLKLARKINLFGDEHPELVNKFYLRNIKEAVETDSNQAIFYRIDGTNIVAGVPASKFPETIEEIMEKFIDIECYELAGECQKLLDRLNIERLIKESN